jgi:hypothetical protein
MVQPMGSGMGAGAAAAGNASTNRPQGYFVDENYGIAQADPRQALSAIRAQRSGGKRDLTGSYRESMMARALQAYLSMFGVGGTPTGDLVGRANEGLNAIVGSGKTGGIGNVLRGAAGQMMNGIDYTGLDNSQILDILGLARGAGTFGYSPMGQYQSQNAYSDLEDLANINQQTGSTTENLFTSNPTETNAFQKLLQRYLAMK